VGQASYGLGSQLPGSGITYSQNSCSLYQTQLCLHCHPAFSPSILAHSSLPSEYCKHRLLLSAIDTYLISQGQRLLSGTACCRGCEFIPVTSCWPLPLLDVSGIPGGSLSWARASIVTLHPSGGDSTLFTWSKSTKIRIIKKCPKPQNRGLMTAIAVISRYSGHSTVGQ